MHVESLWRYPVKSLQGQNLQSCEIDEQGFSGDRSFAIRDISNNVTLTARRTPELLMAWASSNGEDRVSILGADGRTLATNEELSAWLGRTVELIEAGQSQSATYENVVNFEDEDNSEWTSWQGPAGRFFDSSRTQISLISKDCLKHWDERRFRANIVLDIGPVKELVGKRIKIGGAELEVVKDIGRCVMITRRQPGIESDLEVLREINRSRDTVFGVGAMVRSVGIISVGDEVEILS